VANLLVAFEHRFEPFVMTVDRVDDIVAHYRYFVRKIQVAGLEN